MGGVISVLRIFSKRNNMKSVCVLLVVFTIIAVDARSPQRFPEEEDWKMVSKVCSTPKGICNSETEFHWYFDSEKRHCSYTTESMCGSGNMFRTFENCMAQCNYETRHVCSMLKCPYGCDGLKCAKRPEARSCDLLTCSYGCKNGKCLEYSEESIKQYMCKVQTAADLGTLSTWQLPSMGIGEWRMQHFQLWGMWG